MGNAAAAERGRDPREQSAPDQGIGKPTLHMSNAKRAIHQLQAAGKNRIPGVGGVFFGRGGGGYLGKCSIAWRCPQVELATRRIVAHVPAEGDQARAHGWRFATFICWVYEQNVRNRAPDQ